MDDELSELMNDIESEARDEASAFEWGSGTRGARARLLDAKGRLRTLFQQQQAALARRDEQVRGLREAVEAVEFVDDCPESGAFCPWCGEGKLYPNHAPDCLRQRALAATSEQGQEE